MDSDHDHDEAPEYIYSPRADEEEDEENVKDNLSPVISITRSSTASSAATTYDAPSPSASSQQSLSRQGSIEVQVGVTSSDGSIVRLEENEIALRQAQIIKRVAKKLDLSLDCAHLVLLYFKYSERRINNVYFDDIDGIQTAIGIHHLGATYSSSSIDFSCLPCLGDCKAKDGFALGCGHFFCRTCWSSHISASVDHRGVECLRTHCIADKCPEVLTARVITELSPPAISAQWRRIDLTNFVTASATMTWCPGVGCGRAFECVKKVDVIACTCGMRFCVKCSHASHAPIDCKTLEMWQEKNSSEEENIKWVLVNTKKCPGCQQRIEKGLGCNHMTCNKCGYEFCWLCLGSYKNHVACNAFKAPEADTSSFLEAKASLDKYLWYYERSQNHWRAAKFAESHRLEISEKLRTLQRSTNVEWSNADFLDNANDALIECRYALKYSYALGYFMADGHEKNLFEYLQGQLEVYTERLSEFLETPIDQMNRPKIIDNTVSTRTFLKNLEEGMKRGLTNV